MFSCLLPGAKVLACLPLTPKQHHLGNVSEIESNPPSIGAAVLSDLVPDQIRFCIEIPSVFITCKPSASKALGTQR